MRPIRALAFLALALAGATHARDAAAQDRLPVSEVDDYNHWPVEDYFDTPVIKECLASDPTVQSLVDQFEIIRAIYVIDLATLKAAHEFEFGHSHVWEKSWVRPECDDIDTTIGEDVMLDQLLDYANAAGACGETCSPALFDAYAEALDSFNAAQAALNNLLATLRSLDPLWYWEPSIPECPAPVCDCPEGHDPFAEPAEPCPKTGCDCEQTVERDPAEVIHWGK